MITESEKKNPSVHAQNPIKIKDSRTSLKHLLRNLDSGSKKKENEHPKAGAKVPSEPLKTVLETWTFKNLFLFAISHSGGMEFSSLAFL